MSLAGDRDALVAEFQSLKQRDLLEIALDRLEAYKEKIDLTYAEAFLTAIFDVGDDLRTGRTSFFEIQPDMHATRIIHWYIKQEKDLAKRGQILQKTMKLTTGLYLPVMNTSLENSKEERQQDPDAFLVRKEDLEDLREICLEKIRSAAENGKLIGHPKMAYILYRWQDWASPEEPKKWLEGLVSSKDGLTSFLKAFVQQSMSQGVNDYSSRIRRYISLKNIETFVSAETLEEKVSQLTLEKLGVEEKAAVRAFQKAVRRRQEGKSDDDWGRDDEED